MAHPVAPRTPGASEYRPLQAGPFHVPCLVRTDVGQDGQGGAVLEPVRQPQLFPFDRNDWAIKQAMQDQRRPLGRLTIVRPHYAIGPALLDIQLCGDLPPAFELELKPVRIQADLRDGIADEASQVFNWREGSHPAQLTRNADSVFRNAGRLEWPAQADVWAIATNDAT